MRFILLLGVYIFSLTSGQAAAARFPALTINIDSLHQINCSRPTAYLSVSTSGGVSPYTYSWSDGRQGSVAADLTAGAYQITVTDAAGATGTLDVTITEDFAPPAADAGADANLLCSNTSFTLSGSGSSGPDFAYQWTASNGGIIQSAGNTLNPLIRHAGMYTLLVTNTQNGCTASDAVSVTGMYEAPSASASSGAITCLQASVTLSGAYDPLNTTFAWSGPGGYQSTQPNPVVSVPGAYFFTVTDTVTTCATSVLAPVAIDTVKPTVAASAGGFITCAQPVVTLNGSGAPATVTFAWTGPNGYTSALQNPQTGVAGLYTLKVTNPQNGCTRSASASVATNTAPPSASTSVGGTVTCATPSAIVSGSSMTPGAAFSWTGPGGFTAATQNIAVMASGTYVLTVTNPLNGCTTVAYAIVASSLTPPGVTATGGVKTCSNPAITLHANSPTTGVTYFWTGPNNFTSNISSPVVAQSGTYFVTVTNPANGCTSSTLANVTQNTTVPQVTTSSATITCSNPAPSVTATSTANGASFAWSGPNGFTANVWNPAVSVGGPYNVTVTNPANGCTSSSTAFAYENNIPPYVFAGADRTLNCNVSLIIMNPIGTTTGSNFTYQWTTQDGNIVSGANSLYARVDAPGTYTLTVKNNQNGCMAMDDMEVTQSTPVSASVTQTTPVSCFGGATGMATVAGGGGSGSYAYYWSNGSQTATNASLVDGTDTVTITDTENCTATASAVITQPSQLQSAIMSTPQTMVGVNDGTASVTPSGGTSPYTVKWNNGKISQTITNLAPGPYTVTVTDFKGCTIVKTTTVNAINCNLSGAIAATNVTCSGAGNGMLTANISNANGLLAYLWSNNAATKTISGLSPGNYTVTATDAGGCSLVLNAQITSPQPLTTNIISQNNVLCNGNQSGSVTLGAAGGTPPYKYAWSNGNLTATASGLGIGAYTCTVTDANNCSKIQNIQIIATDNTPPQLSLKNATVYLDASGTAPVTAAMFDNGSTDAGCGIANWTIEPAIFYCNQTGTQVVTLTATDQNGNKASGTAFVTVKDEMAPVLICPLDQTVSSCSTLVSYNAPQIIDNCSQTGVPVLISGLASGTPFPVGTTQQVYSYTDPGGNNSICSFNVTVTGGLAFEIFPTPASCPEACNGSATVTVAGNNQGVSYHWSNGQTGHIATALCPGAYTVTVTDAGGCAQSQTISIGSSIVPPFSFVTDVKPVSCSGACDGSISLNISGSNLPIAVQWSNSQSGNINAGLCPGNYSATITDAAGCSQTQHAQIAVQDTEIPVLTCQNNVGTGYCNAAVTFAPPQVTDNCAVDPQQVQLIAGLPSGSVFPIGATTQTYRYTDSGGNTGMCSFTVTVHAPPALSVSASNVTCAGLCNGLAALSISGGQSPFDVQWDNGTSGVNADNLCAGSYTATITDGDGCQQVKSVNITQPQALHLIVDQVTGNTGNTGSIGTGSILITLTGGTLPYTYSWSLNGELYASTEDIVNLFAGQYAVTVTDAKGCSIVETPVIVDGLVAGFEPGDGAFWTLYPNPAVAEASLLLKDISENDLLLGIYDPAGRLLYEQMLPPVSNAPLRIDLTGMPDGLLFFRLANEHGATVKTLVKIRR